MTNARERAIKMYWKLAKEKCPFQTEEIENGYLEGFIDCAELFEEEDKLTLTKYARIIIDKKDECIEELEKENAELKTDYEVLSCSVDDFGELQDKLEEEQRKNNGLEEQLTKAKVCLEQLVSEITVGELEVDPNVLQQAENFLKE